MKNQSKNDSFKFYEGLFRIIIWILIGTSIIALILIHMNMFHSPKFEFEFSRKNIGGYLNIYKEYSGLFTATVAVIVAYLGLQRLKVASEANRDKIKQDRFVEWRTVLEIRSTDIEKTDSSMRKGFITVRHNLFNDLYDLNFKIKNKEQLKKIFDQHFKKMIPHFELMSEKYLHLGGLYQSAVHSYAGYNFIYLFGSCIEEYYQTLEDDLRGLYIEALPEDRIIDPEGYKFAQSDFLRHKKKED